MYPYGSGHPNPNGNQGYPPPPFGAGYPPPNAPPPATGQSPYPPFGAGAPYPPQGGGYPPQQPGGYPGYPPANTSAPYPTQQYHQYPPGQPQHQAAPPSNNVPYPTMGGMIGGGAPYPNSSYPSPYPPAAGGAPFGGAAGGYPMPTGPSSAYPGMGGAPPVQQQHYHSYSEAPKKSQGNPTVHPVANLDATADAQALRKAMKGFGTDEDALINVICRRSNEQRQLIARAYKTNFGKDLMEDLKSECSGNFEKLLVALMTPIVDYYAQELHDAMAGAGTDEDVLIEVLATMSNYEIHTIKNAYERKYGKSLENQIMSETSGNFKRLLVSLCQGGRDESGVTDVMAAQRDATALLRAGELQIGTDESTFNMVLCQRNYAQLKLICDEYAKMTGHSLERAIQKEFSGDVKDGLLAILESVNNKHGFFAERLKKSMAGIGTNDAQLIRIIVTRCEIDLMDIKTVFEAKFQKSLKSWIKGDTSGHYKHALYALIAEQRSG